MAAVALTRYCITPFVWSQPETVRIRLGVSLLFSEAKEDGAKHVVPGFQLLQCLPQILSLNQQDSMFFICHL
jgi:hypothetical protein